MAEYIDREGILGIEKLLSTDVIKNNKIANNLLEQVLFDIQNFPSSDVAPVTHGKWEYFGDSATIRSHFRCSKCKHLRFEHYTSQFDYCPCCGAKMDLDRMK